ncbi:MAG: hypothetical protein F6K54_38200 [Okeania sp. SIO3B5]|uniref:hypothetical protein n=1 Tax=Okeania sp. SIO3B5 TaxID=2607811 RepID=UPI0014011C49|nr:hypothetical protein [Okeania sp. SIO3B5]NEO58376.1 hypothetical protein [Okeania sp. SIO3B5]
MGRWGDGEMGGWRDREIEKYLVMVEDGAFLNVISCSLVSNDTGARCSHCRR